MKKLLFILLFVLSVFIISCNEEAKEDITITFTQNEYVIYTNDTLNVEELVTIKKGESVITLLDEYITTNLDTTKEGTYEIKVSYLNVSETAKVIVVVKEVVLESITLKTKGTDYYYFEQELNIDGYVFELTYSDGTKKEIPLTKEMATYQFVENIEEEPVSTPVVVKYTEGDKTVETTFDVEVYAEWKYEEYHGTIEANEMIEKIYSEVSEMIPNEINDEIKLPESTKYGYDYRLIFTSSNYEVLSATGKANQDDNDQTVILTMTVKNQYVTKSFDFEITVKGLGPVKLRKWDDNEKHIFAYFYEGTSNVMSENDARTVDVINYCFARVENGKVTVNGLKYLSENTKLRRSTGVRIVLSVGGGGSGSLGFSDACLTVESRKVLIDSMMEIIAKYKLDGIDLDWEYPAWTGLEDSRAEDKDNFTLLCKELRVALDAYRDDMLLTAALIGGLNVGRFYDVPELNKYLDYAHIMTYDLNNSGIASHHTNALEGGRAYSTKGAMNTYLQEGFDSKKIIIGAAFYGKISTLATPTTPEQALGKTTTDISTITYTKISQMYLTNPNFIRVFDESAGAYYLSDGKTFITYDDKDAMKIKCNLIKLNNLGGIMFWDYGSDTTGTLLREIQYEISMINLGR